MERRGEGESRTKGELIRQIYWAADRRQVEIGEYEERTRFENPCQTFDTENSRHQPRRANREPSSGFLALVIYDNYTPLPTVWRVCPPLPISWPPNAWHRPPVKAGLNDSRNRAGLREESAPDRDVFFLSHPPSRPTSSFSFLFVPPSAIY